MTDKKAFVFDTNFIIQNQKLDEVIKNLSDEFTVYVPQLSIEERIAQQCRELKEKFVKLEDMQKKYKDIATVKFITKYEKRSKEYRESILKNYQSAFGDNIIPFRKDENTFTRVLERANQKIPPFPTAENASDKGFKDTILWLSLIEFFKTKGEKEIVFVTNDDGFRKNSDYLCEEFAIDTEKTIEIKDNSYYSKLLTPIESTPKKITQYNIENISKLRNKIKQTIDLLCYVEDCDYYGNTIWNKTFTVEKMIQEEQVEIFFCGLSGFILSRIFDDEIPASDVFEFDKIKDEKAKIPMAALEEAKDLYEEILNCYPEYLKQFMSTVTAILNQNYSEPYWVEIVNDDDLPF